MVVTRDRCPKSFELAEIHENHGVRYRVRTMSIDAKRITEAIRSLEAGHDEASGKDPAAELLPMVYAELHRCAASLLAREKPGQTLQARHRRGPWRRPLGRR